MQGSTGTIESNTRGVYLPKVGADTGGADVAEEWRAALVSLTKQMNANHIETIRALGDIHENVGRLDQKLESHIGEDERRFQAAEKTLDDHIEVCDPDKPKTSQAAKAGWWGSAIVGLGAAGKFIAEHFSKADG